MIMKAKGMGRLHPWNEWLVNAAQAKILREGTIPLAKFYETENRATRRAE